MSDERDWATIGGLLIVGASAAITSFSAQANLAHLAGWPGWMPWLLPTTDDVYGVAATRIWLSETSSPELKKHARAHAFSALLLSMAGNAIDHAVKSKALNLGSHLWLLVVAVSLVPPIALGALMHLVTLRGRNQVAPNHVRVEGGHYADRGHNRATTGGPQLPQRVGATTGANTIVAPPVAPLREALVAPKPVAPKPTPAVAPAVEPSNLVEFTPRGHAQEAMRTHWDERIAAGVIPSGADLNRAASKDPKYSLGKKYAKQWRESLPETFIEAVEAGRTEEAREIAAGFSASEWKEAAR